MVATCQHNERQLRAGKTPEQMLERRYAQNGNLTLLSGKKHIQAIDQHMQDHGTLEEDLQPIAASDDRF